MRISSPTGHFPWSGHRLVRPQYREHNLRYLRCARQVGCRVQMDTNAIVDEETYDRDSTPKANKEDLSDHEMTTDAYVSEGNSSGDSDSEDEYDDDSGHYPEYDDEPQRKEERKVNNSEEEESKTSLLEPAEEEERDGAGNW